MSNILYAWLGSAIAIGLLAWLTETRHTLLIMGSFGASCVLVFGFLRFPLSQPHNVIGGHLLASLIGLLFLKLFGPTWWSMALALALATLTALMPSTARPAARTYSSPWPLNPTGASCTHADTGGVR